MEIGGLQNGGVQMPIPGEAPIDPAQAQQAIDEIVPILAEATVNFVKTVAGGGAVPNGVHEIELDEEGLKESVKEDLEALVAYLTMDNTEAQAEAAKKRIDMLKGKLQEHHKTTMDKIQQSIDDAVKAEDAAEASRIFGFIGLFVALIVATVVTVTTGGAAAAVAWVGFGIAVSQTVLSETHADETIIKGLAEAVDAIAQNVFGMDPLDKTTKEAWGAGIYGLFFLIAGCACAFSSGGGVAGAGKAVNALIEVSEKTAKTIATTIKLASLVMTGVGLVISAHSIGFNYTAAESGADVTDTQKILQRLQKYLEDNQDELEKIMDQINQLLSDLASILESKSNAMDEIIQMTDNMS